MPQSHNTRTFILALLLLISTAGVARISSAHNLDVIPEETDVSTDLIYQKNVPKTEITTYVRFTRGTKPGTEGSNEPVDPDTTAESNLESNLFISVDQEHGMRYVVPAFNDPVKIDQHSGELTIFVYGTVKNKGSAPITGYIGLYILADDGTWETPSSTDEMTIPSANSCHAEVNDVVLGTITPGPNDVPEGIPIIKTGEGRGTVTFTGADLKPSGDLQLGGNSHLIVRPADPSYIESETGNWVSEGTAGTIPLVVTVGKETKAGTYTSNLTATLTCE